MIPAGELLKVRNREEGGRGREAVGGGREIRHKNFLGCCIEYSENRTNFVSVEMKRNFSKVAQTLLQKSISIRCTAGTPTHPHTPTRTQRTHTQLTVHIKEFVQTEGF